MDEIHQNQEVKKCLTRNEKCGTRSEKYRAHSEIIVAKYSSKYRVGN